MVSTRKGSLQKSYNSKFCFFISPDANLSAFCKNDEENQYLISELARRKIQTRILIELRPLIDSDGRESFGQEMNEESLQWRNFEKHNYLNRLCCVTGLWTPSTWFICGQVCILGGKLLEGVRGRCVIGERTFDKSTTYK